MKKLLIIVLLLLFLPTGAHAEKDDIGDFDGGTWIGWNSVQKVSFLTGFISASSFVVTRCNDNIYHSSSYGSIEYNSEKAQKALSTYYDAEKKKKSTFTRQEVSLMLDSNIIDKNNELYQYTIINITNGQLSQGLDLFYGDFKNRQIKLTSAIHVIKKQIEGASPEEIEALSQWLRGGGKDFSKRFYVDKEGKKKYVLFP